MASLNDSSCFLGKWTTSQQNQRTFSCVVPVLRCPWWDPPWPMSTLSFNSLYWFWFVFSYFILVKSANNSFFRIYSIHPRILDKSENDPALVKKRLNLQNNLQNNLKMIWQKWQCDTLYMIQQLIDIVIRWRFWCDDFDLFISESICPRVFV